MQDIRPPQSLNTSAPKKEKAIDYAKVSPGGKFKLFLKIFFIIFFLSSAAAVYFATAKVTVTLSKTKVPFKEEYKVVTDAAQQTEAETQYILGTIEIKPFTGKKKFASTATGTFGTKSTGVIKMSNTCTGGTKTVAANSRIWWTEGNKYYRSDESVVFGPSGDTSNTKSVSIVAEGIGSSYNAPDNQTWKLLSDSCISGTSDPGRTSGGESHIGPKVSQSDVDKAVDGYKDELNKSSLKEFSSSLGGNIIFIEELTSFSVSNVSSVPPVDSEGAEFELVLTIEIKALVYPKADLDELVKKKLMINPRQKINAVNAEVHSVIASAPDLKNAGVITEGVAESIFIYSPEELREALNYKSDFEMKKTLQSYEGIKSVVVVSNPRFLGFIPKRVQNIEVIIETE